jgi:hypothetical protein
MKRDREATQLLYTAGRHTVRPRRGGGFVICRDGATHATVVATFGAGLADAFERAKVEADRRHTAESGGR